MRKEQKPRIYSTLFPNKHEFAIDERIAKQYLHFREVRILRSILLRRKFRGISYEVNKTPEISGVLLCLNICFYFSVPWIPAARPAKDAISEGMTIFSALPSAAFSNESSAFNCTNCSGVKPASNRTFTPSASACL